GLFPSRVLKNLSGGSKGGLCGLFVPEEPGGAPDTELARHRRFVETIGDALGRNESERYFGFFLISLVPSASQHRERQPARRLPALLCNDVQWLFQIRGIAGLRERIEPQQITNERIVRHDAQSLFIQTPCFRVAARTLEG